jgi:hypothetical protein
MKIRSVTYFGKPGDINNHNSFSAVGEFSSAAKSNFESAGFEVQTFRFAMPPFPLFLQDQSTSDVISYAMNLERILREYGFDYISLGPALPSHPESFSLIPDLIQSTESTFCSGLMTDFQNGISLSAVRACGDIIQKLSEQDPDGFANLYFAALGNVLPGTPFFPSAYADDHTPSFSIAVEGADLAVRSFKGASSFDDARSKLIAEIEFHGNQITTVSRDLERTTKTVYTGIDFSLAPFPDPELSTGTALESLGLSALGAHGSLAAAAFLADTIDRAEFPRTGFSGLFLPLLEDAVLAERAAEGILRIKDLLLYSAVCGTGLDTIPLPGNISADQISAILFDLAALSLRLNKPLTARLMPIPGKKAQEPTSFDFPYFANSKIMDVEAEKLTDLFTGEGFLDLRPRLPQK